MITLKKDLKDSDAFLAQLTQWAGQQAVAMVFHGSGWNHGLKALAAVGVAWESAHTNAIDLISFQEKHQDKDIFYHLNYDVKNDLEDLQSRHPDHMGFPHCAAFVPKVSIELNAHEVCFKAWGYNDRIEQLEAIYTGISETTVKPATLACSDLHSRVDQAQYLRDLDALQTHIQRGDVYQGNYCQEFYWDAARVDGPSLFLEGHARFPNPFAVYYKIGNHQLLSFSPERFLAMQGDHVMSQPMKGTMPRGADEKEDAALKQRLACSEKDRRENVMIVDMVRNDLSHFATKGSVKVPELYRIETYPKVHQMFSTVEAQLRPQTNKVAALLKAFPMGSMTGAPKVRAMQVLDELEHSRRGIYSGTVGYIRSNTTADFNVVIRSLIYNEAKGLISCYAGGGITALSDPMEEWEESYVKARPLIDLVDSCKQNKPTEPLPLDDARPII